MQLYVLIETKRIYTEKELLKTLRVMRAKPLRDEDLPALGVARLQPDRAPDEDVVTLTRDAQQGADGLWRRVYGTRAFTSAELDNYRTQATQQANDHFERKVRETANAWYPDFEQQTWPQQEPEARAWLADDTAPTPSIDKLLANPTGQVAKQALCERIRDKADAYRDLALTKARELQAHRAAIWAATTKAEVDAALQAALA